MVHIFDVDYTVIRRPSSWYFIREALSKKAIGFSQVRGLPFEWIRYKMGIPNNDFIEEAVKRIAGVKRETLEALTETCFTRRMKAGIYVKAAQLINEIQKRGERTIFASSSLHIMIQPLERFLGISESLASALEFSQGKATGRIAGVSLFGEKKKAAVIDWLTQHAIEPRDVSFYTDSYTDIPLLEYCGYAVAVNPDRFLERHAKKHGWQILRFHKTLGLDI